MVAADGPSYYESNFVSKRWRTGLARMVVGLLPNANEGGRHLDVGVGDGYTIRLVKPDGPVVGIDVDPSMEGPAVAKGVDFKQGSAYHIPFDDQSFDVVTCVEVLEHLERPRDGILELRRVTKLGGSLVLTTPVPTAAWRLLWWGWTKFGPGKRWETSPHVSELSLDDGGGGEHGLVPMLVDEGFRIEARKKCNFGLIAGVRASRVR